MNNCWFQIQMLRKNEWCNINDQFVSSVKAVNKYNEIIEAHTDMKYRLIKIQILRPLYDD